jgi:hypothetical protein
VEFERALRDLGFTLSRRSRGADHYTRQANPYLTYTVQALDDGSALFTWEFAIGEYVAQLGMQVGSDEHLNTFLYPRDDAVGPQDAGWVLAQMDAAEARLGSISLVDPV